MPDSILTPLAFFPSGIGPGEMLLLGIVAVMLFGNRLPEVARSAGKSLTEFKKGMRGFEAELRGAADDPPRMSYSDNDPADRYETAAPAFVPPVAEPESGPGSASAPTST